MDGLFCRNARAGALRLSFAACGGLWLSLAPGCTHMQQTPPAPEIPPDAITKSDKDQPRRLPHAATCVTLAELRVQFAARPDCAALDQQRLYDEAIRSYQQAVRIEPKCVQAYLGLARLYGKLDQHDRATEALLAGIDACPQDGALWFELGMSQARRKEWDAALDNLHKASELDPENHLYANLTGYCLARAGHFDESFTFLAKTQGETKAHYSVARMLYHMQMDQECRKHLQLALQVNPEFTPAQQMLAELDRPAEERTIQTVSHEQTIDEAAGKLGGNAKGGKKGGDDWE
jgi:tetratricopeptide (TPR) repeat protein